MMYNDFKIKFDKEILVIMKQNLRLIHRLQNNASQKKNHNIDRYTETQQSIAIKIMQNKFRFNYRLTIT